MKKLSVMLFTGMMILSLAGCGSKLSHEQSSEAVNIDKQEKSQKAKETQKQEEEQKAQEEAKKQEEEQKAQEEAKKQEEEQKAQEEAKKQEEEQKAQEEAKKQEEEQKAQEENEKQEEEQKAQEEEKKAQEVSKQQDNQSYGDGEEITLNPDWEYAEYAEITSGSAVMYRASSNRKNIVVGVNAGHGTSGGQSVKTLCHPDGSPKTTGGTTGAGATKAVAVSGGMTFDDGTPESTVTLRMARIFRDKLLAEGYDVLMVRNESDVQLDNVARTVICNNAADCHIALHWDGDGLGYDKGCFYISVPDGIKDMEPVASHWNEHDALGECLINGLDACGAKINGGGSMSIDLTQTSYSMVPSVDIELGNESSDHSDARLEELADGLVMGVNSFF